MTRLFLLLLLSSYVVDNLYGCKDSKCNIRKIEDRDKLRIDTLFPIECHGPCSIDTRSEFSGVVAVRG